MIRLTFQISCQDRAAGCPCHIRGAHATQTTAAPIAPSRLVGRFPSMVSGSVSRAAGCASWCTARPAPASFLAVEYLSRRVARARARRSRRRRCRAARADARRGSKAARGARGRCPRRRRARRARRGRGRRPRARRDRARAGVVAARRARSRSTATGSWPRARARAHYCDITPTRGLRNVQAARLRTRHSGAVLVPAAIHSVPSDLSVMLVARVRGAPRRRGARARRRRVLAHARRVPGAGHVAAHRDAHTHTHTRHTEVSAAPSAAAPAARTKIDWKRGVAFDGGSARPNAVHPGDEQRTRWCGPGALAEARGRPVCTRGGRVPDVRQGGEGDRRVSPAPARSFAPTRACVCVPKPGEGKSGVDGARRLGAIGAAGTDMGAGPGSRGRRALTLTASDDDLMQTLIAILTLRSSANA